MRSVERQNKTEVARHILWCMLSLWVCFAVQAQKPVAKLMVLHTNDTHSCVMPMNKNLSDKLLADKGGYMRRSVFINEMRFKDKELLLFDSGDFSQGSPYYNLFQGEVEVKLMNHMRYDACTIGNHEFDFGLENMRRIFLMAKFPVVCANYDFKGTVLEDIVKPYTIIYRKGIKIGVLGVGPMLQGLVSAQNYVGVVYEDPIVAVNRVATHLRLNEKCDLIICLSHLGWQGAGQDDKKMIAKTRYIDVVLGGHSHTLFQQPQCLVNADGQHVVYSQMGKGGRFVGELELDMRPIPKN